MARDRSLGLRVLDAGRHLLRCNYGAVRDAAQDCDDLGGAGQRTLRIRQLATHDNQHYNVRPACGVSSVHVVSDS